MTTFISYSRVNSEFVVRFARDLKRAGFNVWLDQLDIRKGSRWDDEIEKALDSSTTFLIVLSPESIDSQNVKDELGYAIDSGKHILPVLLQSCKIPLRLRRFQFVDFTSQPYEDGLIEIKDLLSNTEQLGRVIDHVGRAEEDLVPASKSSRSEKELGPVELPTLEETIEPAPGLAAPKIAKKEAEQRAPGNPEARKPKAQAGSKTVGSAKLWILSKPRPVTIVATLVFAGMVFFAALIVLLRLTNYLPSTFLSPDIIDDFDVPMRIVKAGEFTMGSGNGQNAEQPAHQVYLDDFYIDKYEVTNAQYATCVDSGVCTPPYVRSSLTRSSYYGNEEFDDYPVIHVDWDQAQAYCSWRNTNLPTEAQWEKAARGPDGRTYPWGESSDCEKADHRGCRTDQDTNQVGSYPRGVSPYGVYDMSGNVSEWVADWIDAYPGSSYINKDYGTTYRVLRGGESGTSELRLRTFSRSWYFPQHYGIKIGFRCATDAKP